METGDCDRSTAGIGFASPGSRTQARRLSSTGAANNRPKPPEALTQASAGEDRGIARSRTRPGRSLHQAAGDATLVNNLGISAQAVVEITDATAGFFEST